MKTVATRRGVTSFAGRVGAEGAHGVDLLGDLHGAELGGHAAGVAAGDHQRGEDGAELLDHGEGDERAGAADGSELLERGLRLQGEHAASEEAGKDDDGQGADADGVHLREDVGPVAGSGEHVRHGAGGEQGILLQRAEAFLGETFEGKRHAISGSLYQMRSGVLRAAEGVRSKVRR